MDVTSGSGSHRHCCCINLLKCEAPDFRAPGEKGRRIRELTSVVQKRFKFQEGSVELYAEKVNNRGLCAIAQAESLRYKLLGGLAVRRSVFSLFNSSYVSTCFDTTAETTLKQCLRTRVIAPQAARWLRARR